MNVIRGMVLPLPTVFLEDGSVDERLMCELTDYYISAGSESLFVGGSFGQGAAMTLEERKKLTKLIVDRTAGRVPVMIHAGTADPFTSIELGKHALAAGADALGFVGPYYYADHTPEEVQLHFKQIGRELKAPLMIYNNPKYQGYAIGYELLAKLRSDSPQIFGCKLAMGAVHEARNYHLALGDDFQLFSLSSTLFPGMLSGIAGTISPPLACCPEIGVALVRAIDAKDYVRALELQTAVIAFESAFLDPVALRMAGRGLYQAGLREIGFDVKMYPRWPTGTLTPERQEWLKNIIRDARNAVSLAVA